MSERSGNERDFMGWLDSLVKESPEAVAAERQESLNIRLAEALRDARNVDGMSQAMVSEVSGLKQSTVSRLEKANHNPTLESIVRYLDAIGADLVLSVIAGQEVFPATEAAERSVTLPPSVIDAAAERGLTVTEYVHACLEAARTIEELRGSLQGAIRTEMARQFQEMRTWMEDRTTRPEAARSMRGYFSNPDQFRSEDSDKLAYPAAA